MFSDCLLIIFASLCSALFAEGLSWLLVYRTDNYQAQRAKIERVTNKLQRKKSKPIPLDKKKRADKRIAQYEQMLSDTNKDMTFSKMQSMVVVGITLVSLFGILSGHFSGRVVARLPFEPISIVRTLSHRGLDGGDVTECSFMLIYILCSISFRSNIQKLLGFAPPKTGTGPSFFG